MTSNNLPDFYKEFNISRNTPINEIQDILYDMWMKAKPEERYKIDIAQKCLVDNPDAYKRRLDEQKRIKKNEQIENEKKNKRNKTFKLVTSVIMAGALTVAGGFIGSKVVEQKHEKLENNVCIEYEIKTGETRDDIEFLEDYGFSHCEVTGFQRNEAPDGYLFAGDVVIGRTTKEKADELVEKGRARIISIEEAVELLGENNSLRGEFKKYAEGKSEFVFYVPVTKQIA